MLDREGQGEHVVRGKEILDVPGELTRPIHLGGPGRDLLRCQSSDRIAKGRPFGSHTPWTRTVGDAHRPHRSIATLFSSLPSVCTLGAGHPCGLLGRKKGGIGMGQESLLIGLAVASAVVLLAALTMTRSRRREGDESPFAASSEGMKRCPKCGRGNLWTDARCIYCGRTLPDAPIRPG